LSGMHRSTGLAPTSRPLHSTDPCVAASRDLALCSGPMLPQAFLQEWMANYTKVAEGAGGGPPEAYSLHYRGRVMTEGNPVPQQPP
jgi:hypothetical protein